MRLSTLLLLEDTSYQTLEEYHKELVEYYRHYFNEAIGWLKHVHTEEEFDKFMEINGSANDYEEKEKFNSDWKYKYFPALEKVFHFYFEVQGRERVTRSITLRNPSPQALAGRIKEGEKINEYVRKAINQVFETCMRLRDIFFEYDFRDGMRKAFQNNKNLGYNVIKERLENTIKLAKDAGEKKLGFVERGLKTLSKFIKTAAERSMDFTAGPGEKGKLLTQLGNVTVGPFKINNEASVSAAAVEALVLGVKRVISIMKLNGFGKALYGSVNVVHDLPTRETGEYAGIPAYAWYSSPDDSVDVAFVKTHFAGTEKELHYGNAVKVDGIGYSNSIRNANWEYFVLSLIHELGHRWWFKFMTAGQREHFSDLYNQAMKEGSSAFITNYAKHNAKEDFAESFCYWIKHPEKRRLPALERFRLVMREGRMLKEEEGDENDFSEIPACYDLLILVI